MHVRNDFHPALATLRLHLIQPPSQELRAYSELLKDEDIYVTFGDCLKNGRLVHAPYVRLRPNDQPISGGRSRRPSAASAC